MPEFGLRLGFPVGHWILMERPRQGASGPMDRNLILTSRSDVESKTEATPPERFGLCGTVHQASGSTTSTILVAATASPPVTGHGERRQARVYGPAQTKCFSRSKVHSCSARACKRAWFCSAGSDSPLLQEPVLFLKRAWLCSVGPDHSPQRLGAFSWASSDRQQNSGNRRLAQTRDLQRSWRPRAVGYRRRTSDEDNAPTTKAMPMEISGFSRT